VQADRALFALLALARALREAGYRFVTVTPETHRRVHGRASPSRSPLRDVFGWSRPFAKGAIPAPMFELLGEAGALLEAGGIYRSAVRFSSLGDALFVHDAYPTTRPDAVFFGPDTYRFCAAIARAQVAAERVVDVGCGTGAGGVVAARHARRVVLADVNERALAFARVNVELAGLTGVEIVTSDVLGGVQGPIDLVVANPPYLRDELRRTYRDGGGELGEALSIRIVREAALRLAPGGTLLLYTGAAVVDGEDLVRRAVLPLLEEAGMHALYEELDPDVFGEELDRPAYAAVERIAAVLVTARR
jgi:release factor glutamine methyltransferase